MMPVGASAEHPWVGRVVGGRFRVTRVLGEGGMGVVYEGEQHMGSTVRKVAIKTLHSHLSKDPSVLARFHRECGTVAQLEHANTIKVYDFGAEADGTLYIAMEFVSGVSLEKVIETDGPLSPDRTVNIMRQVSGALDEAHALGIIHRDLKPENVVLTERLGQKDFVKVLDFGIASRSESADAAKEQKLTQQGMVLGTPPYMSPEQFTGQALDKRSDVYSLGIMAYQMLTGRLPFSAQTPWQWATEHMTAQPFPLEQIPSAAAVPTAMRAAVMRSLSKEPSKRQATAGEFFQELAAGAASDAGHSRPTGTEAMPAAAMGTARTEAMPASPGARVAPAVGVVHAQPSPTPGAMAAPPPPARPEKGGNKGLVLGLGGLAVALLAAIGIVLAKGGDDEPSLPSSAALGAETGPTTGAVKPDVAPEDTAAAPTTPTAAPVDTAPANTAAPSKPSTPSKPATGGTTGGTKPTPSASAPPAASSAPTTTPPAGGSCDACVNAVKAGNLQGAAAAYSSCSATGQAACKAEARRAAPGLVSSAAKGGQCGQAKAIAAAAQAMGASSKRVTDALASCK
jgi:serine/threonine-protein kinase